MIIGLGSYAFRWSVGTDDFSPSKPWSVTDLIDEAASQGCPVLQVADSRQLDTAGPEQLAELRSYANTRGVRLQTGMSGVNEDRLVRYLGISSALGADLLRVVLHGEGVEPTMDESVAALRSVAGAFEASGVQIAIENHFLSASPDLAKIVERVDSHAVGVCLDTANSIMAGEWPRETIRLLLPFTVCVHLKDFAVVPDRHGVGGHVEGRRLGEGWLDLEAVLAAIRAREAALDRELAVILEHWLPLQSDEPATLATERDWRDHAVRHARIAAGVEGARG